MAVIIPILISVLLLSVGLLVLNRMERKDTMSSRVRRLAPSSFSLEDDPYGDERTIEAMPEEKASNLALTLNKIMQSLGLSTRKYEEVVGLRFAQAGITSPSAMIYYVFMKRFGLAIALFFTLILMTGDEQGPLKAAIATVCILLVLAGAIGADLYVKNRKDKRQKLLMKSFPDTLDLILVCVESGLALDAALSRVTKELERAHPEITKELNKTRMELTLLNDRIKALQNLAERTDLIPFKALVASLLQSEKFGTSLTETLRVLSDDYRQTRLMIAENKAGRLPALMTIPMMLLMMPAFVMIIMGPAIISFLEVWNQK